MTAVEPVPVMAVDRRIIVNGQHVATALSSVGFPGDIGPWFTPAPSYSHGDEWERDLMLIEVYRSSYRAQWEESPPRRSLETWRRLGMKRPSAQHPE